MCLTVGQESNVLGRNIFHSTDIIQHVLIDTETKVRSETVSQVKELSEYRSSVVNMDSVRN